MYLLIRVQLEMHLMIFRIMDFDKLSLKEEIFFCKILTSLHRRLEQIFFFIITVGNKLTNGIYNRLSLFYILSMCPYFIPL